MGSAKHDPLGQRRIEAFVKRLGQLGWIEGRSMQIDDRWGDNDADRIRRSALELVTLAPDDRIGIPACCDDRSRHEMLLPLANVCCSYLA
jgi:hypothetical protein